MTTTTDWRADLLDRLRGVIRAADPEMIEERKWRKPSNGMNGVPVWSHDGIVCTGETYKQAVKMTFARGAFLKDPSHLFNASLEGGTRRAIDFHEGDRVNEQALAALVREAVALNASAGATRRPRPTRETPQQPTRKAGRRAGNARGTARKPGRSR